MDRRIPRVVSYSKTRVMSSNGKRCKLQLHKLETDMCNRPALGLSIFGISAIIFHCLVLQHICFAYLLWKALLVNSKDRIIPPGFSNSNKRDSSARYECATPSHSRFLSYNLCQRYLLLRCIGFFALIGIISSTPLVDLTDGNSIYKIPIKNETLTLIYDDKGIVPVRIE